METLQQIKEQAESGNAEAQFTMGLIYLNGRDTPKDYKKAFQWWIKLAERKSHEYREKLYKSYCNEWYAMSAETYYKVPYEYAHPVGSNFLKYFEEGFDEWFIEYAAKDRGSPIAYFLLGVMYYNGHGISQDYKKAAEWFACSAVSEAQFILGVIYYLGQGVQQDYNKAAKWFTKAAKEGLVQAQIILGLMYECGQVEIENYVEAYKWYLLAGLNGLTINENKNSLRELINVRQIAEAQYEIGEIYHHGLLENIPTDYETAINWYTKAAEQENENAQIELAKLYYNDMNYSEAHKWFLRLAMNENGVDEKDPLFAFSVKPDAYLYLGKMYYYGKGVTKNYNEAYKWFSLAGIKGADVTEQIVEVQKLVDEDTAIDDDIPF